MLLGEAGRSFLGFVRPAYLQVAHGIVLSTSVLCAFVEYPGNPLTELPGEIREFLKGGMVLILGINAVLAGLSIPKAQEKRLPLYLWLPKIWVLGGLAFYEISRAPSQRE
jgi:hypothetical protein